MTRTVVALDVDGTLYDGVSVSSTDATALRQAHDAGHVLVIVTGRRWDSAAEVLGDLLPLFARVVGEEGGVLLNVASGDVRLLAPALEPQLVHALRDAGVEPLDAGLVMVGTDAVHEAALHLANERTGGLRHVVVNKGSAALAPNGTDKGTGLRAALADLGVEALPLLAIGDAANDLPMFAVATVAMALANADDVVRAAGVPLTDSPVGSGVAEALRRHLDLP